MANTETATSTYATDTTHFLVGKLSSAGGSAYDTMELWINPDSTTLGTPDATASGSSGETDMNYWMMRNLGTAEGDYIYDEFRVGTTMESVVIPEPSTVVLFGGALVLFGLTSVFRRRS